MRRRHDMTSSVSTDDANVKISLVGPNDEIIRNDLMNSVILDRACIYTPIFLRFTFDNKPKDFTLHYDGHILSIEKRTEIIHSHVVDENIHYFQGLMHERL